MDENEFVNWWRKRKYSEKYHKSRMTWPGIESEPSRLKAGD